LDGGYQKNTRDGQQEQHCQVRGVGDLSPTMGTPENQVFGAVVTKVEERKKKRGGPETTVRRADQKEAKSEMEAPNDKTDVASEG